MEAIDPAPSPTVDSVARRAGFTALYDEHVTEVYRFVHRLCCDRDTAEDVTQDAFLTAVRTVHDPADVSVGWLIRVARNRLLDVVRRQARYADKLRMVGRGTGEADQGIEVAERLRMQEALEHLHIDHRVVLTLHYVDGLTIVSLAEKLGRTPKAIEALVTRARRNLRRELEKSDA
ncbi:MAG: RNA polymerase sigma factor [Acidimicrobiales bacterium]